MGEINLNQLSIAFSRWGEQTVKKKSSQGRFRIGLSGRRATHGVEITAPSRLRRSCFTEIRVCPRTGSRTGSNCAATAEKLSPKPRAMAASAWMGVNFVAKCAESEEGEEWVEVLIRQEGPFREFCTLSIQVGTRSHSPPNSGIASSDLRRIVGF